MNEAVLFVDDEPNVLEGISRALRNRYDVFTAGSGVEGLQVLQQAGPFAVVVSDMRMPQMNGVQFLSRVRDLYPDTVRVILSGQADLPAAIAAVNEGNIFRFLSKPCPTQQLLAAVGTCIEQHHLVTAERVLLEQTLSGAVGMLLEILGLIMPAAHARAVRLRQDVTALAGELGLTVRWQWPLAAALSQIGFVSLPRETALKVEAGQALSDEERALYEAHPALAARMLRAIPRLEDVAAIVADELPDRATTRLAPAQWDVRTAGILMLRSARALDAELMRGTSNADAVRRLALAAEWPACLLQALARIRPANGQDHAVRSLRIADLAPGMQLEEAILTRRGICLVPVGHVMSSHLIARLMALGPFQIQEPFLVRVPL